MQSFSGKLVMACVLSALPGQRAGAAGGVAEAELYWPQWRGPSGTGVAPAAQPPIQWSETNNVRWKTAIPGKGHSTPILWGQHLFLTTAIPYGEPLRPRVP